jgi:hypothetical protein
MKSILKTWMLLTALFLAPFAAVHAELNEPHVSSSDDSVEFRSNLGLFLFIHDQVSEQERTELGSGYLNTFLAHMEEVTGRRTTVTIITDKPGFTDFAYRQSDQSKLMSDWSSTSIRYADENNLPPPSERHKYMLVTSNKIDWLTHGVSAPTLNVGIASTKMYNTIGHEIGHLLGAEHEAASGLPCQTIMWPNSLTAINPCYYFSEANQDAIHEYLNSVD